MNLRPLLASTLVSLGLILGAGAARAGMSDLKAFPEDSETVEKMPADIKESPKAGRIAIVVEDKSRTGWGLDRVLESSLIDYLQKAGIAVVERSMLEKVMQEQKFQMEGLVASDKVSEFGQLSGATHVLMASVDSADSSAEFDPPKEVKNLFGKGNTTVGNEWKSKATAIISLRAVNVATGEVVASAQKKGQDSKTSKSKEGAPLKEMTVKAVSNAADDAVPELQKAFPLKGYIIALRGKKKAAMINLGKLHGVVKGRKFRVLGVSEFTDATGKTRSSKSEVTSLKIEEVEEDAAWGVLDKGKEVRLGMSVESLPEGRSIFHGMFR